MVYATDFIGYADTTTTDHRTTTLQVKRDHSAPDLKHNGNGRRRPRSGSGRWVDFAMDTIQTIEVEHMEDLPGADIWYSKEDYDAIKARNGTIVRLIKSGEFEENDEYSCRGLEHKLKEVFRQRRTNKFTALNAVLEEQDRQINQGVKNEDLICEAYRTVTVKCQQSANTIAFRDYRFSYNYSPNTPATGFDQPLPPPSPQKSGNDKKKKKEKKEKKKEKDKDKEKDKHKHKEKHKDKGGSEDEEDEEECLSPKKKGKVRQMAKGARRMMRRMSM